MSKKHGASPMDPPELLPRVLVGCGHANTETWGENRYWCPDCGLKYRKVRGTVLQRRRLLRW